MKTVLWATIGKDQLFDKSKKLNMDKDAGEMFMRFTSVPIEIEVDKDTGIVKLAKCFITYD